MPSDEELVGRLAAGDESAMRDLLVRYERGLSSFLHRNNGGRDVEDLYQETWLRVVRGAAGFDRSKRFSTWMFQIAVNLCRDWRRRRPPEPAPFVDEPAVSAEMARAEAAVDVQRLLAALPAEQREVLILRYYHDMTEEQAAEVLGCPRGTVKSRTHGALARLAKTLGATGEGRE
jgi:RNA polymerase sigma-70 factor (ECF subfamily)